MQVWVYGPRQVLCVRLSEVRRGRGGGGGGRTAFDADGGEAEVALVGEVAGSRVAPCRGEDEGDHGAGEEGREEAGDDISRRT